MAIAGLTTGELPKDAEERGYAYEGRRSWTVYIKGIGWVPMMYFGPFGLNLALPAAIRDAYDRNPHLTATHYGTMAYDAMMETVRWFSTQSPIQGISAFYDFLTGQEEINRTQIGKYAGFIAGQLVPMQGLQRFITHIADPVYRKSHTFMETLKRDVPWLSHELKPYKSAITGKPAQRSVSSKYLPYPMGAENVKATRLAEYRRREIIQRKLHPEEED